MGSLNHKVKRYKSLVSNFKNWNQFLLFKAKGGDSFRFKMRNGFEIDVPKKMLPPFKESFFDRVYLQGFPENIDLGTSPVVVDIGANVGFFALYILSQIPGAKIFGFEPMPFNFNQLSKYQTKFSQFDWTNFNKAVAEHDNGLTLFSSTLDGFSTMAGVFASDGRGEKIEVETLTLPQFMNAESCESIDLLKFDCEGSEYSILYALTDEELAKIRFMSIETHKGTGEGNNHHALVKYLKEKGLMLTEESHNGDYGYIWAWRK